MADHGPRGTLVPIGRFAKLAGLTVPQLRHYDRRGLLPPAARDRRSGYRYYSAAQAAAARAIALLRQSTSRSRTLRSCWRRPIPNWLGGCSPSTGCGSSDV